MPKQFQEKKALTTFDDKDTRYFYAASCFLEISMRKFAGIFHALTISAGYELTIVNSGWKPQIVIEVIGCWMKSEV
jgi:hypothetical protein